MVLVLGQRVHPLLRGRPMVPIVVSSGIVYLIIPDFRVHVSLFSELPGVMARHRTRHRRVRKVSGEPESTESGMRLLNLNQVGEKCLLIGRRGMRALKDVKSG